jgi:hypothetical protein
MTPDGGDLFSSHATCTHEIDATQPLDAVVEQLVAIGEGIDHQRR